MAVVIHLQRFGQLFNVLLMHVKFIPVVFGVFLSPVMVYFYVLEPCISEYNIPYTKVHKAASRLFDIYSAGVMNFTLRLFRKSMVVFVIWLEIKSWWNTISFSRTGKIRGTSFPRNGFRTLLIHVLKSALTLTPLSKKLNKVLHNNKRRSIQ